MIEKNNYNEYFNFINKKVTEIDKNFILKKSFGINYDGLFLKLTLFFKTFKIMNILIQNNKNTILEIPNDLYINDNELTEEKISLIFNLLN